MNIDAAERAARAGDFNGAKELLSSVSNRPAQTALWVELAYYTGESARVVPDGLALLGRERLSAEERARTAIILGWQFADKGNGREAQHWLHQAVQAADETHDLPLRTRAAAALLEFTCHQARFDISLPLAAQVRRLSRNSGDSRALAITHLTFARMEATLGHYDRADRHLALARQHEAESPNLAISASADICASGIAFMMGQPDEALRLAELSLAGARRSGWCKLIVAAAANAATICVSMDRFTDATSYLDLAQSVHFSTVSYDIALAETRARIALASDDFGMAEQFLRDVAAQFEVAEPWEVLSGHETLIIALLGQERFADAAEAAERGLALANKAASKPFVASFVVLRAEALSFAGNQAADGDRGLEPPDEALPPSVRARVWLHIGRTIAATGGVSAGREYVAHAGRLFGALGNRRDSAQALSVDAGQDIRVSVANPSLNSAAALTELGRYPYLLGPEALAVIDGAGCARGAALIATGAADARVIDARNWDEHEALAARRRDGVEIIPLGEYRNEAWSLVVDPRPELEHRCTLIAIRKLIATSLSLDRYRRDEQQRAALWPAESLDGEPGTVWASEQTAELLTIARRIAPTPLSVLLTGETGTGKEMLAHTIHRASDRADRTFLPFNCTAVPREMLDSQLFGYRKGAFTGADASFAGVIRSASGGTLFLDEIAEIGLDVQPKLLRFLETHEIHPIGEPQPIHVDVRVIAATNANLERLVAEGKFREDLFYRLNVVRLTLPPLRERREEIPPLVQHYLERFAHEHRKERLTITDELLEYLLLYAWPGNVRQLANEVRRMVAMAEPGVPLTPALLSPEIQASRRTIPASASAAPEIRLALDQPLPAAVQALEQSMIRHALRRAQGRVEEAARLLGISRKGLFLKRRRWGLGQPASETTAEGPASPAGYVG